MTLKTDIDQIAVDAGILHSIVQGPVANVTTAGGPVKSVAKAVSDAEAAIISGASSYLVQVQAERDTVLAAKALAESAAASAGSVMQQDLSAIDRTVFASATLVDAFLYDTSKDSDGGAWRKRCAHTSWENETLSGNWLGSAANETAARAISGAVTGSFYYDTTALGFYTLNAGSGKTATYRGNVRQFPAKVLITVEAARVVLWDLTQAGCPMWMAFVSGSGRPIYTTALTSVAALNGQIVAGAITNGGLCQIGFIRDYGFLRINSTSEYNGVTIANRHVVRSDTITGVTAALVAQGVNDVAMTVLPNAPVDVATGLPIPTIDVFTDAGTSRINTDGTVADLADTAGDDHKAGCILASGDSVGLNSTNGNVDIYKLSNTLADTLTPDRTYDQATTPALLEAVDAGDKVVAMRHRLAIGQDNGVNRLIENPASVAAGMIAYMTKDYNSGWQVGAIKGAWLADTVAETLTGAELVTNGTFATDATGWTAVNGAGLSVASGELTVTNSGATNGCAAQAITTVAGKTYVASATVRRGTATSIYLSVGTTAGGYELAATNSVATSNTTIQATFTATGTTTYISARNDAAASGTGIYDNISCRLADVDRSVKAKGLQAFGSLTKAVVASGSQLIGYSGWSAANFLEQPYNSDLDFGTGNFCVMGWIKPTADGTVQQIVNRGAYAGSFSGSMLSLYMDGTCRIFAYLSDDAAATYDQINSTGTYADGKFHFAAMMVRSAVLELWIDGVKITQTAVSNANLGQTNTSAKLRVGLHQNDTAPGNTATVIALVRASAYAPTVEQMKHIFETEKALFEANAQCCLAGTSNAVTALAYDDETDLLHVGTSYGRSAFKGLVRVASEATPVGAIVALAAGAGVIVQAGATAVDVYVPAYSLREELLRDAEQMARFGQNLIAHDFTATASQTNFALPVGWEIVAVYQQGALKRETTSWTRSFDGFVWSAVLGTGATVSDWISILAKRV